MTRVAYLPLVALVLAMASPAAAQPTDQPEDRGARQSGSFFDVTVDLFGAFDRALGSVDETQSSAGDRTYFGGNSELAYEKTSGRFSFGTIAGASVRRLTNVTEGTVPSYSGSLYASGPLTRRTRWDLLQSLGYGPTNAVPFFGPGDQIQGVQSLPLADYRLADNDQFTSNTRGSLDYLLTRRGSVGVFAGFDRAGAPASPEETSNGAFRRWNVGARYSHRMTRYLSWYAGYGLTENSVSGSSASTDLVTAPRMHNIDSGISYGRALSFSRRTRIDATFGSSIIQDRATRERQWRANGTASLRHELGRTWLAQLAYYRDTAYLPAYADPVMSDAVTVGLTGNLSEKASLNVLTNYSMGKVGLAEGGNNGYRVASASTSFRYAFLRQLAAYVEYFLFDSDFDSAVMLTDTRVSDAQRHGVRFGMSIGTGLWGNRRRGPARPTGETTR